MADDAAQVGELFRNLKEVTAWVELGNVSWEFQNIRDAAKCVGGEGTRGYQSRLIAQCKNWKLTRTDKVLKDGKKKHKCKPTKVLTQILTEEIMNRAEKLKANGVQTEQEELSEHNENEVFLDRVKNQSSMIWMESSEWTTGLLKHKSSLTSTSGSFPLRTTWWYGAIVDKDFEFETHSMEWRPDHNNSNSKNKNENKNKLRCHRSSSLAVVGLEDSRILFTQAGVKLATLTMTPNGTDQLSLFLSNIFCLGILHLGA